MRSVFLSAFLSPLILGYSANAGMVYHDVADITVPFSDTDFLAIDFNGDAASRAAIVDLNGVTSGYDLFIGNLDASNVVVSAPAGGVYSETQDFASRIGPSVYLAPVTDATVGFWPGGDNAMQSGTDGYWAGTSGIAFLGVTFNPNPSDFNAPFETYLHGWVRMEFNDSTNTVTLLDLAYETTPNTGITTGMVPEPHGAVLALLGAGVFFARRRRFA